MARSGGIYSLPEAPFVYEEVIDEEAVNNNFSDIATALTQSIASDGQTTISANLPMAGYKHTGVGNASASNHYAAAGQVQDDDFNWCGTAGGTANAITLTPSPAITAYAAGQRWRFIANGFNTGAVTAAISGLAARNVFVGGRATTGDEIFTGRIYELLDDGTQLHLTEIGRSVKSTERNYIVNPHADICQARVGGVVPAGSNYWVADQWLALAAAANTLTVTRETMTPGTSGLPYEQQYFMKFATSGDQGSLRCTIEGVRTLAEKVVTLTFWAKGTTGATITPTIVQRFGTSGSPDVSTAFDGSRTLSTSWSRYRQTATLPSVSGKTINVLNHLSVRFAFGGTNNEVDIAYIQLQEGPQYTYIDPRPVADELVLCERYYQKSYSHEDLPGTVTLNGAGFSICHNTEHLNQPTILLKSEMRAAPTVTYYSPISGNSGEINDQTATTEISGISTVHAGTKSFVLWSSSAGFTAGNYMRYHWTADARI